MRRAAGILLHPTCLPGSFGIGDLGRRALEFLDWLDRAGQSYWQVLPLGPVGHSGSPYGSYSAFAGNSLLISPQRLVDDGLAEESAPPGGGDRIDFPAVATYKESLVRRAWRRGRSAWPREVLARYEDFLADPDVRTWLEDWTLYAAVKNGLGGTPWNRWPMPLRTREEGALADARRRLSDEIEYHRFVQFLFVDQWSAIRAAARERGIRIVGDLAIYVAPDSADVWANQDIFDLDETGHPRAVAGVPPDYFSATGQRWGNPLYDWDRLADTGFDWWIRRLRWSFRQADIVRLDHFRGFASFWEIPAAEETAVNGRWRSGPGLALFEAAENALGTLPLIAEDLGVITDDVTALRQEAGFPGMRVLQFGFDEEANDHRPHRVPNDSVIYTGTHDNDTARGWFGELDDTARQRVLDYVGGSPEEISWSLVRTAFASVADTAIAPLQDVLDLGSSARLNQPGLADDQWSWRLIEMPDSATAERLRTLTAVTERLPPPPSGAE